MPYITFFCAKMDFYNRLLVVVLLCSKVLKCSSELTSGHCPLIPEIENGHADPPPITYVGLNLRIRCEKGYAILDGCDYITCTQHGVWTSPSSCKRVIPTDCIEEPTIPNAVISSGPSHIGATRYFHCAPPSLLTGTGAAVCEDNGEWKLFGKCLSPAEFYASCAGEPVVENSRVILGSNDIGTKREFRCLTGFSLTGSNYAVCDISGKWLVKGQCHFAGCSQMRPVENGYYMNDVNNSPFSLVVVCFNGYSIYGPDRITCNLTEPAGGGKWTAPGVCAKEMPLQTPKFFLTTPFRTEIVTFRGPACCKKDQLTHSEFLIEAAKHGNLLEVSRLLNNGADANSRNIYGWTPILWAANQGHATVIDRLLDCCANVDLANNDNETALILAAKRGILLSVELLLRKGAYVNAADFFGYTPLLYAVQSGHATIVEALLKLGGVDTMVRDRNGNTALMVAIKNGRMDIVNLLLNAPGVNANAQNKGGQTALMLAAKNDNVPLLQRLVHDYNADINAKDAIGYTALSTASAYGNVLTVTWLLERGALPH